MRVHFLGGADEVGASSLLVEAGGTGMSVPRFKPDLVVCESTYGNSLHASRRAEEERLIETVFTALRAGQKVLVPAFALGRAQEVNRKVLLRLIAPAQEAELEKYSQDLQQKTGFAIVAR